MLMPCISTGRTLHLQSVGGGGGAETGKRISKEMGK